PPASQRFPLPRRRRRFAMRCGATNDVRGRKENKDKRERDRETQVRAKKTVAYVQQSL
ncbi:hypothetical protein COCCADRAFT_102577, partial [Bipolaris zeicola 26-R-13]